jgi:iron complex outermembrane receptor protein
LENFERLPLIVVPASPTTPPQTLTVLGNPNLKPEEMLSYEVGYHTFLFERLRVRVDLFYNQLEDVVGVRPVLTTINPLRPPVQTGTQFNNVGGADIYGGEVALDLFVTDWLTGFLNYSYQERIGAVARTDPTPHHKGNVGLLFSFANGLSATVLLHHVGEPEGPAPGVSPYTIVNARLGYRFQWFGRETELALQAFNLFDDVHREFPAGDLIERRVSGTLSARFQ